MSDIQRAPDQDYGRGPLSAEQADAIYDVLLQHAGEVDRDGHKRRQFIHAQTRADGCVEYRFCGALGFDGKFWRSGGWYVSSEDRTPERDAVIQATNAALSALASKWAAASQAGEQRG